MYYVTCAYLPTMRYDDLCNIPNCIVILCYWLLCNHYLSFGLTCKSLMNF